MSYPSRQQMAAATRSLRLIEEMPAGSRREAAMDAHFDQYVARRSGGGPGTCPVRPHRSSGGSGSTSGGSSLTG